MEMRRFQCREDKSKSIIPLEDEIPFFELSLHQLIGRVVLPAFMRANG